MKVLVFSDSHGRTLEMYDIIEREAPDAVIHLGDCVEDARMLVRSYPNLMIWYVRGNNDYERDVPNSLVVSPGGIPMYLTHGHLERVSWSSIGVLPRCALEAGCEIAFYGHTHRMQEEQAGGVLVLNPGSISLPRGGLASYMRMVIQEGSLKELSKLDKTGKPYDSRNKI